MTITPLTEEELQRLEELEALQKRQKAYEKQKESAEAKAKRDKFNRDCVKEFGLTKKQIKERLDAATNNDYEIQYNKLLDLIKRLGRAWDKGEDWNFRGYVEYAEKRKNEQSVS